MEIANTNAVQEPSHGSIRREISFRSWCGMEVGESTNFKHDILMVWQAGEGGGDAVVASLYLSARLWCQ